MRPQCLDQAKKEADTDVQAGINMGIQSLGVPPPWGWLLLA